MTEVMRFEKLSSFLEENGTSLSQLYPLAAEFYDQARHVQAGRAPSPVQLQQQASLFKPPAFQLPGDIGELTKLFMMGRSESYGFRPGCAEKAHYDAACVAVSKALHKQGFDIKVS